MGSGSRRSLLPALLPPLLLPLLPAAWGDCGLLPNLSHAEPPEDTKHQGSFSVGTRVTYRCLPGYTKLPLLSDTIQCLTNSQWSNLPDFCGRSCPSPPRVQFAKISQEDETQNFYAVGTTVRYVCRPGYEKTTDQLLTSTCLDDLSWSEVPKLCHRKSCGTPANPEHGKVLASEHLFGARADVICNHGYTLKGASSVVWCLVQGNGVAWGRFPACQAVSCPLPPALPNGKHNSSGTEEFPYGSAVTYTCDPGLQLVGSETLRCTTEDEADGVWSGPPPECREVSTAAATNQSEPSEKKTEENPYWLAAIIIPCCTVALGIPAGIIMKWKGNNKHSHNIHLQKHKVKGRDPMMHPEAVDAEKQPVPWHSYFCHTASCHVSPTCEKQLHAALGPHPQPGHHVCATCEDWLSTQPGSLGTYSVLSISTGESQSPPGTRAPAKAADVLRDEGTGEAVPEQSKAELPVDHGSSHHVCPVCESWVRAHLGPSDSQPVAPRERPRRQEQGPRGPVCPPCADRLYLSLVQSDTTSCPVCPLAGEGTPTHLVPPRTPSCHLCPVCTAPTHTHLCQAPEG